MGRASPEQLLAPVDSVGDATRTLSPAQLANQVSYVFVYILLHQAHTLIATGVSVATTWMCLRHLRKAYRQRFLSGSWSILGRCYTVFVRGRPLTHPRHTPPSPHPTSLHPC